MSEPNTDVTLIELTADIVSAYVSRNSVRTSDLSALIESVHVSLGKLHGRAEPEVVAEPLKPAVPIKRSITEEVIFCLEDGKRFKSLKRHLSSNHGMTPQEYRAKWGLAKDYPMVAPAYASERSTLARSLGLGQKAKAEKIEKPPTATPEPEAASAPAKGSRRRVKAAA